MFYTLESEIGRRRYHFSLTSTDPDNNVSIRS